ncbi:unnamed protein product [Cochlearia groenlandica]
MGGEGNIHWIDLILDEIDIALTNVDESIQKSIDLITDLAKDLFDNQPIQDTTEEINNGESNKSNEEDSSQDKVYVTEVKDCSSPCWSMCLGDAREVPNTHWSMSASKTQECLIQDQGNYNNYSDSDYDDDDEEEDDETMVSNFRENVWDMNSGRSASCYLPHDQPLYSEENNDLYMMRRDGYEPVMNDDTSSSEEDYDESSSEDDESWDSYDDGSDESLIGHDENQDRDKDESESEDESDSESENEDQEESESDDEDESEDEEESEIEDEDESEDEYEEEDNLSEKSHGFLMIKEEEIVNDTKDDEAETTFHDECEWVFVYNGLNSKSLS